MGEALNEELLKRNYCIACLNKICETNKQYDVRSEALKTIFQTHKLSLCFVCRKIANYSDLFIQNVQSNQILLENIHNISESTLEAARTNTITSLSHCVLDNTEITPSDSLLEESYSITTSLNSEDVKVKTELKEELEHLDHSFLDDNNDFQEICVKEENDSITLQKLKEELREENINIRCLRRTRKKGKKRKIMKFKNTEIHTVAKEIPLDERYVQIQITREQCLAERAIQAADKKFLEYLYKCEDCIKGFEFKGAYEKHKEKHSKSNGDYECDICKQRMSTNEKLLSHKRYHEIRYKCSKCPLMRVCRLSIKNHYSTFHAQDNDQYTCELCFKSFRYKSSLRRHKSYLHTASERVWCAHCNKSYKNKRVLTIHMKLIHPKDIAASETVKKHICKTCGAGFKSPSKLKMHSLKHSHSRNHYCVECDKGFKSYYALKQHLKTASSHVSYPDLPLSCAHCSKRFAIRRDLERHINRMHLNIKPYGCDKCDKAYANSSSLLEHQRFVHDGYKRPLNFPCSMCDKVFNRKQILKSHIRTHTGERPFQCTMCPSQFSQSSVLGTHVKRIHLKVTRDGTPKKQVIKEEIKF